MHSDGPAARRWKRMTGLHSSLGQSHIPYLPCLGDQGPGPRHVRAQPHWPPSVVCPGSPPAWNALPAPRAGGSFWSVWPQPSLSPRIPSTTLSKPPVHPFSLPWTRPVLPCLTPYQLLSFSPTGGELLGSRGPGGRCWCCIPGAQRRTRRSWHSVNTS